MATSSTLKTLKEQDGVGPASDVTVPTRAGSRSGRLKTWRLSIWRRRWLVIGTAWLACGLGWIAVMLWPTNYVASAVIHADLVKLANRSGTTDQPPETPVEMLKSELLSEAILADVRGRITLDPAKGEDLEADLMLRSTVPPVFVLAYEHQNPDKAKQVLETVIAGYRARLDTKTAESSNSVAGLDEEIADHKKRLEAIEVDLAKFRRVNADYLDENRGDQATELEILKEDLAKLKNQAAVTIADRDLVAVELAKVRDPKPYSDDANPARSAEDIETERQTLEAELTKLQERYADTHPYVVAVFDAIEALDTEVLAEADGPSEDSAPIDRDALEQRHGELIVEVSTLSAFMESKRQEIEHLKALTTTGSSVEAELSGLEAEKQKLASALSDLQHSRDGLGDDFGGEATQEAFRLIKRPELPTEPVGPSRLMALAAVLLGGTGLGAAVGVFCNRLRGVFESAWQLRQRFDVGVLGTITEVMSPAERKRVVYARLAFGLACLALFGVFSGLVAAELTDSLAPFGDRLRTELLG